MDEQSPNLAVYRALAEEAWSGGDAAVVERLVDASYSAHDPTMRREPGQDGLKKVIAMFREGFPDLVFSVEDAVEHGERLAVRFRLRGTHRGVFVGIPGTGRAVDVAGMTMARFAGGRLAEEWVCWDALGLIRSLGGGYSPR
jgi:steroid delta-isomerase-like uncharacterized protein